MSCTLSESGRSSQSVRCSGRKLPRLREWAYAGVFFEMSGAVESHVLVGDPVGKYAAPLAFTFLTLVSWWFQPDRETPWIRKSTN